MYVPTLLAVILAAAVAAADPSATPSPATAPTASVLTVHIKNFAFVPAKVQISPGRTVRFVNDDDMTHTVTADDKSYDSGELSKGQSWSHVFAKAGASTYYCFEHPFMKGSIVVGAP